MLDPRVYRAALLPVLLVLIVVAFSLEDRPGPLRSSLASDAFDGARAAQLLEDLARRYPARRAGSPGDAGWRARGDRAARGAGPANRGAHAQLRRRDARRRSDLLRYRPGPRQHAALADRARRGARLGRGGRPADLSGTAALLEVARVVAAARLQRTVTFASVSGGSGGEAGMRDLVQRIARPVDAVIEIGDLGGESSRPLADRRLVGIREHRVDPPAADGLARRAPRGGAGARVPAGADAAGAAGASAVRQRSGRRARAGIPSVRLALGGELPADDGTPVSRTAPRRVRPGRRRRARRTGRPARRGRPTSDSRSQEDPPGVGDAAARRGPAAAGRPDDRRRAAARAPARRQAARAPLWVLALAVPFAAAALLARALGLAGAVPDLAPPAARRGAASTPRRGPRSAACSRRWCSSRWS